MTARGLHAMHRQGTRTEETIDRVLDMIGPKVGVAVAVVKK